MTSACNMSRISAFRFEFFPYYCSYLFNGEFLWDFIPNIKNNSLHGPATCVYVRWFSKALGIAFSIGGRRVFHFSLNDEESLFQGFLKIE